MRNQQITLGMLIAIAFVLRCLASAGDLWLDEILSLTAARNAQGVFGAAFAVSSDNNHPLVSAWMYALGAVETPLLLRFVSVLCGLGTLILVATWIYPRGAFERLVATLLFSFSYLFVLYDSEARGYSPMLFCGLLAWRFSPLYIAEGKLWQALIVVAGLVGSTLAHVTGMQWGMVCALATWNVFREVNAQQFAKRWQRVATMFLPVIAFDSIFYLKFVQHLPDPSGALRSYLEVLINLLSVAFGGLELSASRPDMGVLALGGAVAVFLFLLHACRIEWSTRRVRALLFFVAIFILPSAMLLIQQPRVIYERYFLISVAVAYFAMAGFLAELWQRGKPHRIFAALLLTLILGGHGMRILQLLKLQRGHYGEVVEEVVAKSPSDRVLIASDQEFRARTVLEYYAARVKGGERLEFEKHAGLADWFILQSQDPYFEPLVEFKRSPASEFKLYDSKRSATLSGSSWFLYQATPN